jgi:hypothetical protein
MPLVPRTRYGRRVGEDGLLLDGDGALGAAELGLAGEWDLLRRELVEDDVGVAVLVAQLEDLRRGHVAERVTLAELRVDHHARHQTAPARRFSGAGSASSLACHVSITSASGGPSRRPGVNVAGRCVAVDGADRLVLFPPAGSIR